MNKRRARVQKIVTLRQKELDDRVAALAKKRTAEREATQQAEVQKQRLAEAEARRREVLERGCRADEWDLTEEWVATRTYHHAVALRALYVARLEVQRAQKAVLAARNDMKRLELLVDRLDREDRAKEATRDQKESDEHAARIFEAAERAERRREAP